MTYRIVMENLGGELERRDVKHENKLQAALIDLVESLGSVHPGDTFRIIDLSEED